MIPTDKRIRALETAVTSAIEADAIACANCKYVHMNPDLSYACWKAPPMPIGAFTQGRTGALEVQTASIRAPTQRDAWCGSFERKVSA
jgi:hypothetical protein